MVRDALATCRVELWSATHWPPLFPQAHRRSCSDEGPAQRGHLLTGVGARKQAVGNTTVATPGSVSRLDTAGVQKKGAVPRTAQETGLEKLCSCLRFSAAPCVAFCVLCRWFCFPVRFCCPCLPFCAGCWVVSTVRVFPSLCFTGADPETEQTGLEGNPQVLFTLRGDGRTRLLTLVETLGCLLYCAQYNSSQLSRLRPFSLPRIVLSTGLLGNGNDTTACGHPFSQFLRHVAASRPILD